MLINKCSKTLKRNNTRIDICQKNEFKIYGSANTNLTQKTFILETIFSTHWQMDLGHTHLEDSV